MSNAALNGAIGAIIYSDPEDDAASLKEGVYPDSRFAHEDEDEDEDEEDGEDGDGDGDGDARAILTPRVGF